MFAVVMRTRAHIFRKRIVIVLLLGMVSGGLFAQVDKNTVPQKGNQSQNSAVQQQNSDNLFNSFSQGRRNLSLNSSARYLDSANYYSGKVPLKAIDYINKAIAQSIHENDKATESAAYLLLGNLQQNLRQHDLAIENYLKCLQVSQTKKSKIKSAVAERPVSEETLFQANKHMAMSYLELGETDKAEARINASLAYLSVPASELLAAKRFLATVKQRQGKTTEAITLLNEVVNQEKQNGNSGGEASAYSALGEMYQEQKNDDKAIEFYTRAKKTAEKGNHVEQALQANDLLAKIFRKQKNLTKELEARNSKIDINTSTNNTQGVMKENIEIGNAYLSQNQMEVAQTYYDKGLMEAATEITQSLQAQEDKQLFPKSNSLDETANTYKLLAEQYLRKKDPERALVYLDKYAELQDSIRHVREREVNEALSISTGLGRNQQRIELLEKERQLAEKSVDILKQDKDLKEEQLGLKNIIIGVLVFFIFSMLMAGFFVMRSSREKRRVNQLLALKSLRGQMNPHFIFNALNSVNHYISQNDERKANRYLSDFSKLMRMVMDSSKHSLISLNEELEMLRLYLQLEHTRFNDKFDYMVDIGESLSDMDFEVPPMLIQPYLENAVWHGLRYLDHKGKLTFLLEAKAGELVVTVMDNGIGRERSKELKTRNQKKQASIGMQNIENRIGIMNDLFTTNIRVEVGDAYPGEENCGTKVTLYIPQQHQH